MPDIAGLKLIVPTSATATGAGSSATVSATGKVTFTAVETLTVQSCFNSTYDNYLIVMKAKAAAGDRAIRWQWRAGSTNANGANYTHQWLAASSTTISASRSSSQTQHTVTDAGAGDVGIGAHIYIYGPNLAQPTAFRSVGVYDGASVWDYAGTHSLSTAYDSFYMFPSASTITGTILIYGLSQ